MFLQVAPDLERMLVWRRGILTVPQEDAIVSCSCITSKSCKGLGLNNLPLIARHLQRYCLQMAEKFQERMRIRGYQLQGNLRLHGPWPSYEFNQHLVDVESSLWREAQRQSDPTIVLPLVVDRTATSPYSDYLLVGQFLKQAVLTEIWIPNSKISS